MNGKIASCPVSKSTLTLINALFWAGGQAGATRRLANEGRTHINTAGTRDYMSGAGHEEKGCTCHINTGSLKSKKMGTILKLLTTNNSPGHSVVCNAPTKVLLKSNC